ncbi:PREDICTED: uncharacterized protein LOC106099243 isoform X2 [Papilio polytes]|uniref:uncharacterized protein LOC106099243 isoform X2 n=1 Tax=Papilio polytes TaxID=76194 RepID=UPI0006765613|nr:PREDICTED: uncharacterized protein LOC106099243 isoform X2 [Papilio polytes]
MSNSCFTLTFAVEVVLNEENPQHDNTSADWTELGPCSQGLRLHYNLYQGYTYDVDVLMWPNAGKIWCGNKYGWVRTWQFFNKLWMVFTIRHKFPVKVEEFRFLEIVIAPTIGIGSLGSNARNDKDFFVLIPPLEFGELRYFGKIVESGDDGVIKSIINSIWKNVIKHIPASCFDGEFDTPLLVSDVRHQDAILGFIRETMLSSKLQINNIGGSGDLSHLKDKGKKSSPESESYKLKISGEVILAGSGRLNRLLEVGHRSTLHGRILAVVSASNLPAQDDLPIMFVNIKNLEGVPINEFKKAGIHQIYTRWKVGKTEHDSVLLNVTTNTKYQFNDNHVIPIEKSLIVDIFNALMDNGVDVQLRGLRRIQKKENLQNFFSTQSNGTSSGSLNIDIEDDLFIASTRIDVRELSKGSNKVISGEFSLYPEQTEFLNLKSDCTNYVNDISMHKNKIGFQPHVVFNSQMMLELSVGLLGCEISLSKCFSRLYVLVENAKVACDVLENIEEINQVIHTKENYLTGFYLDTGDKQFIFVEGEKNKDIVKLWEEIESYSSNVKCNFSSSDTYLERIYPEMVTSNRPFDVLKMRVSLSSLLACPPVYALPVLPLPSRMVYKDHMAPEQFVK